ncbi:YraN family protein [Psychrobacter lutiphocae]|uniref:YraN family protein n=1 Tax=Psychrobacter lutiphocae TaxID=540500 RepID=UPI00035C0D33|nr:YraN family protein [Psychrobacter lutiphocae]
MPSNPDLLASPKQCHGGYYEQLAASYLQQQGLILIASNWQQPKVGEIDLVMLHLGKCWHVLLFIEVRKRKITSYGDAAMSVTKAKQRKLIKTAYYFLQQHPQYAKLDCRFDVVAYNQPAFAIQSTVEPQNQYNNQPEWIQGAFLAPAW